jgi:hypothetical protein
MSLEFPIEKRKIGKFYFEVWDSRMVEYHSSEKSGASYVSDKIKEGLQNSGLTLTDIHLSRDDQYGALVYDDLDIGFMITIAGWYGTTVAVYIQRKKIGEWRAKFKKRLADLEKILEVV